MARTVKVAILGSGGAVPSSERLTSSLLVSDWLGNRILLDAGEAAQLRLSIHGATPQSIDVIALTHEHGDHVNGLAGLLMTMSMQGRKRPLHLVGPKPVIDFALETLEATTSRLGFEVITVVARAEGSLVVGESGGSRVILDWFPVDHTVESVGYRVRWILGPRISSSALERLGLRPGPWIRGLLEKGRAVVSGVEVRLEDVASEGGEYSIVYTGDTRPSQRIVEYSRGALALIHDSTFDSSLRDEALERGHSTSIDAARAALEAEAMIAILTHISGRYRGFEARRLEAEARRIFPNSILAWDGMRLLFTI